MRKALTRSAGVLIGGTAMAALLVVAGGSPAGAVKPLVAATIHNANGDEIGTIVFSGSGVHAERAEVELALPAGAPGLGAYHGLHVHAVGTCTGPAFTSAGGHWNLTGASHGNHTGDLPSVLVGPDGTASAAFETHRFDVSQLLDADGSAIVLHAGIDNFGNVPIAPGKYQDPDSWYTAPTGTGNTGDAGGRYGCGVFELA